LNSGREARAALVVSEIQGESFVVPMRSGIEKLRGGRRIHVVDRGVSVEISRISLSADVRVHHILRAQRITIRKHCTFVGEGIRRAGRAQPPDGVGKSSISNEGPCGNCRSHFGGSRGILGAVSAVVQLRTPSWVGQILSNVIARQTLGAKSVLNLRVNRYLGIIQKRERSGLDIASPVETLVV